MRGLLASPLGLLIGLSLGSLGGGGSVLAVPALVYGAGEGAKGATATSLMVVGLSALMGAVAHWRKGRVRVGPGTLFGLTGTGGSVVGSRLNAALNPNVLLLAFSGLMVLAAWRMWASKATEPTRGSSGTSTAVPSSGGEGAPQLAPAPLAVRRRLDANMVVSVIGAGSVVGFTTGFFGVGGGFVVVPALVLSCATTCRSRSAPPFL